jgi:hypothetical protein
VLAFRVRKCSKGIKNFREIGIKIIVVMAADPKSRETRVRLEKCWEKDIEWDLIPTILREVF